VSLNLDIPLILPPGLVPLTVAAAQAHLRHRVQQHEPAGNRANQARSDDCGAVPEPARADRPPHLPQPRRGAHGLRHRLLHRSASTLSCVV
jgi:hypothetical protein